MVAGIPRAAIDTTRLFLPVFSCGNSHRLTGRTASEAIAEAPLTLRLILGITLLLLGLGSLSCQVQDSVRGGPIGTSAQKWVRTVDGWERPEMWTAPSLHEPRLHPFVVAAGQALVS